MSSPDSAGADKKKRSPHGSPSGRASSSGAAPFRHPDFSDDQIQRLTSTLFNLGNPDDSLGNLDSGAASLIQSDLLDDMRVRQTRSKSEGARSSVSEESVLSIVLSRLSQTQLQLAKTQQALAESQHRLKQRDVQILLLKHKLGLMRRSKIHVFPEPSSDKTSPERVVRLDPQVKLSPSQGYESGSDATDCGGGSVSFDNRVEEVMSRRAHPSSLEVLCRPPLMDIPSVVPVDYDLVLRNVGALNQEVGGEGTAQVAYTDGGGGAILKIPEAVPLTLYSNGIQVAQGPFRDMYEPSTQQFLVDLMDGFYPAELQRSFPRGVPLRVKDKRHITYKDPTETRCFWGQGKRLCSGNDSVHPLLVPKKHGVQKKEAALNSAAALHEESGTAHPATPDPGTKKRPVSLKPKHGGSLVRKGKQEKLALVSEDPVPSCSYEDAASSNSLQSSPLHQSSLHLKVRSESGDKLYHLHVSRDDSVGELRRRLDALRSPQEKGLQYDLVTCYPTGLLGEDSVTLGDYGVTSNSVLYLRTRFSVTISTSVPTSE